MLDLSMVTYSNLMFFQLSILCSEWFLADHTDFFLHSHFRVLKSENKIQLIPLEIECCFMFNFPKLLLAQFWKKHICMHLYAHIHFGLPFCLFANSLNRCHHPWAIRFFSTRYDIWLFYSIRYRYDMLASKKTYFLRNFLRYAESLDISAFDNFSIR